jgi:hypothetical protein
VNSRPPMLFTTSCPIEHCSPALQPDDGMAVQGPVHCRVAPPKFWQDDGLEAVPNAAQSVSVLQVAMHVPLVHMEPATQVLDAVHGSFSAVGAGGGMVPPELQRP